MWVYPLDYNIFDLNNRPVNTIARAATNIFGSIATDFRAGDTIDGVTLAEGDVILIKDQVLASENGIYVVNTGAPPTRSLDLPTGVGASGYTVFVTNGTTNENSYFICENEPGSDTVGTDDLVFTLVGTATGNGSGEVNTASNQGSDGIGVFIQKTGVDLQFKNISTNDTLVNLSDDTTNNTIDIDLSDLVVTTNGVQTLTNKTITDAGSNVAAGFLFADSRGTLINIESSTGPVVGQILKATSNTTATWQNETGGAGESNTMSNQGVGGVGVFKQKTGVNFEMKNINATNNTISVIDDTANNEVDIAVNAGNISRNELTGTLSVANGGTGATSLTSGNVLVGDGTNAVTTTKAAPTGDFVGTTDTQVLTNKDILDSGSNVAARTLVAVDGDVLIDISGSAEPTTGQILIATSNTTATWQDNAGGSAEANTGSNQGAGGVGVFIQKTGVDLEFRSVNAGNNTISVVSDTTNNEIDISVNAGNIDRNELSGTLNVANGGTGTTTLTSGNVLVGDGTNAVTTTKAAPTGDFVGTTDTQTLTNKTIVDSGSNVAARTLVAADGAVLIDISASAEPTTGQVLKATSNTTATWQADDGENNTASNQGVGGIPVFIQKTGVDLEFRSVNAVNNTIAVVSDTTNNEIDLAVNVGNISRNELSGTLNVANGGTGTTTLTSGNVLIGDGTNAVTTTKAAPTGDFVGTTDTQVLTNKTIVDSGSNVAARTLVANNGGILIDISESDEPTVGQVLKATSNTTAIWQDDTGEANTGSNQGAGGVAVFIQKTGVDLEFRSVNAVNNTIAVVSDTTNNEIDLAVNVGNINRNELTGTLTVANGGTGAVTHGSGNVLIGAGTSAITSTKAAPTGDFVGTTDAQTLTNKTIVDSGSNVAARTLVANNGGILIDISDSDEPTIGQVLKATSNTTAIWQDDTGEANTGSNQGAGGVAVFIQKTGVDLEFRSVNAVNNTIAVVSDTTNNEIDLAVNAGNINRNELTGTLTVANGGTGAVTHGSGNVLIGAGTSAITSTKAAPTGDFVGTTDTQVLTNKTIVDSGSNIAARTLVAVDGDILIDISGSAEPTIGQLLIATSNTTAIWSSQTASNQGAGGVGVFIQKSGNDFEFRSVNAVNNTIAVVSDTTNNEIDLAVNVGNISRNELTGTLSVSNGGTGATSLTSGNVLVGDGSSAVTTTKAAPTGDFVGTTDTQTLTNKTIVDSGSNVAARTLVAADGAVLIDISGSAEPTTGQILRATSNTTATWQADTTASNQGSSGVGIFIQKNGTDLEFKNLTAFNNTISIVDDTTNNEIDIAVNAGNISRNELSGTLSVANGGTGTTTLTSGNVLVGDGTNAVTTTKAAPTGDFVGTTDTQTLTNKTIVDSGSNVAARTLVAADGAVLIDISGSSEPTTGQVLKATSNTTATWQADDGENNTASNQGAGGVAVFIQKTGVDLEFRSVNAVNNTIAVISDTTNNEIDLAVNAGNISRNELADTLTVANGGTGATSLTSGNVLIGAGTSAVTTTKAAPTGDFVGTTDTQTLTNKTIVDSGSNVAARTLVASDGAVLIDISASGEPVTGQILKATSNTTATWQNETGGAGESNTASNQGVGGVGTFIQKTGVDLEFKNINSGNNTISVIDNTPNNEIDISVNAGNIGINDLLGTLSVANGGTGATTLTSGNVLIGDGTNAVTTTKAAPTGDFVGTTDTQTLTNKTIVDSGSNVAARTLVASDGAVLIDISASGEPVTGQILKATSNTTATWQNETGGAGESNTASNQGTGGVGVFIQKTGVDLEFKNVNAFNNTISIVDDTTNNEIDIAVNAGNIGINDLSGTLSVANGGTGATSLTSGNVLVGDGTNAVTTTKAAPTGDFVGTTDTQVLTNKNITDSGSNVAARTLVAADGAVLIDISGSSEPTTGQILKATSNTTATWQDDDGEANTGSNQGAGGVAVFIQKTGVDLEFRSINAVNNTIAVVSDTTNNEIDLAVNVGNINRNELTGTLTVANGGTGATSLTSGNVLVGDGTNAVTTTKAAPTGDFVGTTDTQVLTNKTIVDSGSNVAARTLVAADGAVLIDISGSAEPTTGQVLKATSNTTATWQADTGEANTGSNQGAGGVAVFIQKTGVDLEFRSVNAVNNTIAVVSDTTNNEIDLAVNVGNINRNELTGTLSVPNGGTGATSLTSGNVLVGDGTNAVTTTKAAPTGDFVGTTDTQTLTNKTIVDSGSNVAARTLVAADGAVLIDISGSAEPTTGQVLKATSNTTATWQAENSGETNTASNQGAGGVGVFIQKTGVDLEFRNINSPNNTISVTNDTTNNEIDIAVNVGNLDHGELTGLGDDDHTQYALLAGRAGGQILIGGTASGNDLELQSTSNATKGSVLVTETTDSSNTTTGALVVSGGTGIQGNVHVGGYVSTDNGYFMGVHTAGAINLNAGFTDITWELEKRKDSIYTHNTSAEAIAIGVTGDYKIIVDLSTDVTSGGNRSVTEGRIMRDTGGGYTELSGTRTYIYNRTSTGGENSGSIHFIETLTAGDFIKVQAQRLTGSSTIETIANGCRILIEKI